MSEQKPLQVGDRAPDFTLRGSLGSKVTLASLYQRLHQVPEPNSSGVVEVVPDERDRFVKQSWS